MLSANMEDYIEAIYIEQTKNKVVRVKDLTENLNVKTSSVIGALKNLSDKGYINHEKYGYIELTNNGRVYAEEVYKKHTTLTKFLHEILGIKQSIAEADACQIEHHIHGETVKKLKKLIYFIEHQEAGGLSFVEQFKKYDHVHVKA